jgi:uncharacterized SAM-binding protein YcdF (DUF218 family)
VFNERVLFALKKFVAFWLMPLPFCLTLFVIGVGLLWSRRRQQLGRFVLTVAVALMLLLSNKVVSTWLLQPLEAAYPSMPDFVAGQPLPPGLAACRYVVVLGGGHGDTPGLSAMNKLSESARARIVEGVRIVRVLPDAKLIVSGMGAPGMPTHAEILAESAESLGIDASRIIRLDSPRDTENEALALREIVGDRPFALVTSAWHMRRAAALMRHAGLQPVPCPTDYKARPSPHPPLSDYTWDTESLGRSTSAIYERIGYLWARLRGKV